MAPYLQIRRCIRDSPTVRRHYLTPCSHIWIYSYKLYKEESAQDFLGGIWAGSGITLSSPVEYKNEYRCMMQSVNSQIERREKICFRKYNLELLWLCSLSSWSHAVCIYIYLAVQCEHLTICFHESVCFKCTCHIFMPFESSVLWNHQKSTQSEKIKMCDLLIVQS